MTIGERIKKYREKKKISKSELARMINVSPSYITMLENGSKTNPSEDVIFKISIALGVDYQELLSGIKSIKGDMIDLFSGSSTIYENILNLFNDKIIKDDDQTIKFKSALADYLKYKNTSNDLDTVNKLLKIINSIIDYSNK